MQRCAKAAWRLFNHAQRREIAIVSEDFSVKDILSLCVDWSSLSISQSTLDQFVGAVEASRDANDERRTDKRKPVVLDVIAVPLDAQRQPAGEPFLALTRNISHGGISILHTEKVSAPYLLLRLETQRHQTIQAVIQVVRSRSFYQFTEISGRFEVSVEKKRLAARSPKRKSTLVAR
jgi:hypothetical protein